MSEPAGGTIDFFEILGVDANTNIGSIRNTYKKKMKSLVQEIAGVRITDDRFDHYLIEIAKLNAAAWVLRDNEKRDAYVRERDELTELEKQWHALSPDDKDAHDRLRRTFDAKVKTFLSKYVEETVLEAGLDREVAEASRWSPAHTRHATKLLREYRQRVYHDILERLPFHEVTPPKVDWDERAATVDSLIAGGAA